MSRFARIVVVALSVAVVSYVALGYVLGKTGDDKAYRSLTVYGEVLQHIQQDYVEEPNLQLVTSGALHGLLESLDPLSSYLSPREYAEYKQKSQKAVKGEVGAVLSKRFGYVIVVSVLPDGPAQKGGLRSGDILEAIAGFTTREMSVGQAQILLAGEPGSTVKVSVVRRGRTEPQEVELARAQLPAVHVVADKIDPDVAYVRMATLDAGKANELADKLAQFDRQGLHKLVLDLRGCAQGSAAEAVAAAQIFLPSGLITTLRGQTIKRQDFSADPAKVAWKYPVTVLISSSTSGAAEVLASALGGNKRAELVGERTYGSASEQRLIEIEGGAALFLTVANYFSPAGRNISDDGVTPTAEVRTGADDLADAGGGEDRVAPEPPANRAPAPADDPVLRKALELLKGEVRKAA